MSRFAVVCKLTWVVLHYVVADSMFQAKKVAKEMFPGKDISVVYSDDCIATEF